MSGEKRALFLSGAGTLTLAEAREWAEEIRPGVFDSIPSGGCNAPMDADLPLAVTALAAGMAL